MILFTHICICTQDTFILVKHLAVFQPIFVKGVLVYVLIKSKNYVIKYTENTFIQN